MTFFVYHGFVDPDSYDASDGPVYRLTECVTVQELSNLKRDHEEGAANPEASNAIFRVIEGVERELEGYMVTHSWRLKGK